MAGNDWQKEFQVIFDARDPLLLCQLLDSGRLQPNSRSDSSGETVLHAIAAASSNPTVKQTDLLNRSCRSLKDLDVADFTNWTPLHSACKYGSLEMVGFLLGQGAATDVETLSGALPLHYLAARSFPKADVELLTSIFTKLNSSIGGPPLPTSTSTSSSSTPLAASSSSPVASTPRLAKTNLVAHPTVNLDTPLHYAIAGEADETVVQILCQLGADPNAKNGRGSTPVLLAIAKDNIPVAKRLLEAGGNADRMTENFASAAGKELLANYFRKPTRTAATDDPRRLRMMKKLQKHYKKNLRLRVLGDFKGGEDELIVKSGDVLRLVEVDESGWLKAQREDSDVSGWIPCEKVDIYDRRRRLGASRSKASSSSSPSSNNLSISTASSSRRSSRKKEKRKQREAPPAGSPRSTMQAVVPSISADSLPRVADGEVQRTRTEAGTAATLPQFTSPNAPRRLLPSPRHRNLQTDADVKEAQRVVGDKVRPLSPPQAALLSSSPSPPSSYTLSLSPSPPTSSPSPLLSVSDESRAPPKSQDHQLDASATPPSSTATTTAPLVPLQRAGSAAQINSSGSTTPTQALDQKSRTLSSLELDARAKGEAQHKREGPSHVSDSDSEDDDYDDDVDDGDDDDSGGYADDFTCSDPAPIKPSEELAVDSSRRLGAKKPTKDDDDDDFDEDDDDDDEEGDVDFGEDSSDGEERPHHGGSSLQHRNQHHQQQQQQQQHKPAEVSSSSSESSSWSSEEEMSTVPTLVLPNIIPTSRENALSLLIKRTDSARRVRSSEEQDESKTPNSVVDWSEFELVQEDPAAQQQEQQQEEAAAAAQSEPDDTMKVRLRLNKLLGPRKREKFLVFQGSLDTLAERTGQLVPTIVNDCIEYLESGGHLTTKGLFRISGAHDVVEKIKAAYKKEEHVNLRAITLDPHAVSSALKLFFRSLVEPLFTFELYDKFVEIQRSEDSRSKKIYQYHQLITKLSPAHFATAETIFRFIFKVAEHHSVNLMTPDNLSVVFGPNFLRPIVPTPDSMLSQSDSGVVLDIINNIEPIFASTPALLPPLSP